MDLRSSKNINHQKFAIQGVAMLCSVNIEITSNTLRKSGGKQHADPAFIIIKHPFRSGHVTW